MQAAYAQLSKGEEGITDGLIGTVLSLYQFTVSLSVRRLRFLVGLTAAGISEQCEPMAYATQRLASPCAEAWVEAALEVSLLSLLFTKRFYSLEARLTI